MAIVQIELTAFRRARIWLNEPPNASFEPTSVLSWRIPKDPAASSFPNRSVAVELVVPLGGRIGYGLLCASYKETSSDLTLISVMVSEAASLSFETPLYNGPGAVFVGLPLVFTESVKKGALKFFADQGNCGPPGELTFNGAAFSEVGSSPAIFEQISKIICKYLLSDKSHESIEDLGGLF